MISDQSLLLSTTVLNDIFYSESSNHSQNTSQIESSIIDIDVLNDVVSKMRLK